jgi:ATP-binding cassette subfamily G (WHITE) protein 2 (PDR)
MSVVGNFTANHDRQSHFAGHGNLQRTPSSSYPQTYGADNAASARPEGIPERTASEVEEDITALARQISRQVSHTSQATAVSNVFDFEQGSDLDPYSKTFNSRKWVKSLNQMAEMGEGEPRTSGIAYKNMGVHGFGSDAGELARTWASKVGQVADGQTTKRRWPTHLSRLRRRFAIWCRTASARCRF